MEIIADLQLHSKYSRAVSKYMELPHMAEWAEKKGINLITTGDWQHPKWFEHIRENLVEAKKGVYELKSTSASVQGTVFSGQGREKTKFILVTEISSIYTQGGKGRRVHNLLFSPSLDVCEKFIKKLEALGANLSSDGRPIVGLSSKQILELCLETDENMIFLPAHVWTPWFGLFGSKSGFDSIEEAFGDLSKYIYAIETGLSSDPSMNWGLKELNNRNIVSFSDAHSVPKMRRECTVFKVQSENWDYLDIIKAIKNEPGVRLEIDYTIEFFPEEGKYHLSGHRAHDVIYSEEMLRDKGPNCPVCGKKLTIGVEHRICSLSERVYGEEDLIFEKNQKGVIFVGDKEKHKKPFVSLIPLLEILQEVIGSKTKSAREYERLVSIYPEFDILLRKSYEDIESLGVPKLSEAIKSVRERKVKIVPGYDGVYGKISINL